MKTNITAPNDKGFRFPPEIISHADWGNGRANVTGLRGDEHDCVPRRGTGRASWAVSRRRVWRRGKPYRKGQILGVNKGDITGQVTFIVRLFGVAA